MKKNRSNIFTTGLTATIDNDRQRKFVFFEIDELRGEVFHRVQACYAKYHLDVVVHRSGMGWHWLSPTEVSLKTWLEFMNELRDVNTKCPMQTLRVQPNKYPGEELIWYNHMMGKYNNLPLLNNNKNCVNYLNHLFKTTFEGNRSGEIELVRYPLPLLTSNELNEASTRIITSVSGIPLKEANFNATT